MKSWKIVIIYLFTLCDVTLCGQPSDAASYETKPETKPSDWKTEHRNRLLKERLEQLRSPDTSYESKKEVDHLEQFDKQNDNQYSQLDNKLSSMKKDIKNEQYQNNVEQKSEKDFAFKKKTDQPGSVSSIKLLEKSSDKSSTDKDSDIKNEQYERMDSQHAPYADLATDREDSKYKNDLDKNDNIKSEYKEKPNLPNDPDYEKGKIYDKEFTEAKEGYIRDSGDQHIKDPTDAKMYRKHENRKSDYNEKPNKPSKPSNRDLNGNTNKPDSEDLHETDYHEPKVQPYDPGSTKSPENGNLNKKEYLNAGGLGNNVNSSSGKNINRESDNDASTEPGKNAGKSENKPSEFASNVGKETFGEYGSTTKATKYDKPKPENMKEENKLPAVNDMNRKGVHRNSSSLKKGQDGIGTGFQNHSPAEGELIDKKLVSTKDDLPAKHAGMPTSNANLEKLKTDLDKHDNVSQEKNNNVDDFNNMKHRPSKPLSDEAVERTTQDHKVVKTTNTAQEQLHGDRTISRNSVVEKSTPTTVPTHFKTNKKTVTIDSIPSTYITTVLRLLSTGTVAAKPTKVHDVHVVTQRPTVELNREPDINPIDAYMCKGEYSKGAVVTGLIGGMVLGGGLVYVLFYFKRRCSRYVKGNYRPVPMEYDFELNPRFRKD